MKLLVFFTASLLVGLATTAPTSDSDKVTVTNELFPEEFAIYTAEHDIVNILVPLNALNFEDDTDDEDTDADPTIFFALADDQGLYVRHNGEVKKILEHGRDAAAANDDTKSVYFAAKEGLFSYNVKENRAEKYGAVDDSIISIAKVNGSDVIYVLTEDHILYKVSEEGTKKEQVESVVNAQQIILDYENNLYYYTPEKSVYVLTAEGVKKIEGLPEATSTSYINILKPPFIIENGVPVILDNKSYVVYANGSVELGDFEFQVYPTAYSMEATLMQYYGYNKKIYEYNILNMLLGEVVDDLKDFFEGKSDSISEIATRSRGELKA